jgi:hypothetical protein
MREGAKDEAGKRVAEEEEEEEEEGRTNISGAQRFHAEPSLLGTRHDCLCCSMAFLLSHRRC